MLHSPCNGYCVHFTPNVHKSVTTYSLWTALQQAGYLYLHTLQRDRMELYIALKLRVDCAVKKTTHSVNCETWRTQAAQCLHVCSHQQNQTTDNKYQHIMYIQHCTRQYKTSQRYVIHNVVVLTFSTAWLKASWSALWRMIS